VDKGTGLATYEVAERHFPFAPLHWETAQSPYVLEDQALSSDVYVKAIDQSGNERVSVFPRSRWLRPYELALLCGILVIGAIFIGWIQRRKKHI
jgi:hypothetical protein